MTNKKMKDFNNCLVIYQNRNSGMRQKKRAFDKLCGTMKDNPSKYVLTTIDKVKIQDSDLATPITRSLQTFRTGKPPFMLYSEWFFYKLTALSEEKSRHIKEIYNQIFVDYPKDFFNLNKEVVSYHLIYGFIPELSYIKISENDYLFLEMDVDNT